jgi:hypothetical protein
LALLNLSIREPSMRSAKEEARASPNMALRSEKTCCSPYHAAISRWRPRAS